MPVTHRNIVVSNRINNVPLDEASSYSYRYAIVATNLNDLDGTFQNQLSWWKKRLLIGVMRLIKVKSFGLPVLTPESNIPLPAIDYRGIDVNAPLSDFERRVVNSDEKTLDDKLRAALGRPKGAITYEANDL